MLRRQQGVFVGNIKLIIVDIVQKHIDTAKVIGGKVDFLTIEALTHTIFAKNLCQES